MSFKPADSGRTREIRDNDLKDRDNTHGQIWMIICHRFCVTDFELCHLKRRTSINECADKDRLVH